MTLNVCVCVYLRIFRLSLLPRQHAVSISSCPLICLSVVHHVQQHIKPSFNFICKGMFTIVDDFLLFLAVTNFPYYCAARESLLADPHFILYKYMSI